MAFVCTLLLKTPLIISCVAEIDGRVLPSHPITFLALGGRLMHTLFFLLCHECVVPVTRASHVCAIIDASPPIPISGWGGVPLITIPPFNTLDTCNLSRADG